MDDYKAEVMGGEDPEHAVIACIHGDETCGFEAIQNLKDSDLEFKKPVKLVIANEKARKKNQRYLEKDLNRCFPGNPESEIHEEQLASKILKEIEGMKVLDLHSTFSDPTPLAFFVKRETMSLIESTGVKRAVDCSFMKETMMNFTKSIVIECGRTGSEEAARTAFKVTKNFLGAEGIIETDYNVSQPELYQIYDEAMGEDYIFMKKNFEKIEEGEPYAYRERDGDQKVAEEDFIPILMSDNGYPHKIGYKGRKLN